MFTELIAKEKSICVVGLGYVGLPVALELARRYRVLGFDIHAGRVEMMRRGEDPSQELDASEFRDREIYFTSNPDEIREASFYIVAVPTPIDRHKKPDLGPLLHACETVGRVLSRGDVVVFESTVYPGCTEEDCVPVLERNSGLSYLRDFKVGYSPERINPGDREHTLSKITKVVSGSDDETLELVSAVYGSVIAAGIHKASSIRVAEASKIIENTQRDLNIALMNELSMIFKKMGINTYEVLEASGTKWNFLPFSPGLVGGHCIGVDPYYLTHKADDLGYHAKVITAGRNINDTVHVAIAREVVQYLIERDKLLRQARVLILGLTFKENVTDIRNSKVPELIHELRTYKIQVDPVDPHADPEEFRKEYGISVLEQPGSGYDVIILAVGHREYLNLPESHFLSMAVPGSLFYDVKGQYRGKMPEFVYTSL
jgi:UDP-N-acetyl-D-glucosamine/UDP-N-acetyl-D-galactosamine dehydrogenase